MEGMEIDMNPFGAYKDKTVLVTGHTGFKGSWLSIWLSELKIKVVGFSLPEWDNDYLFNKAGLSERVVDERGDIGNLQRLNEVFLKHKPNIVFHLAAQPLVRDSYTNPVRTFDANIMGTVNVLECIRKSDCAMAGVMITTDKCYKNKEQKKGYGESDELGGHDPYSASKASAELVIDSYRKSFFTISGKLVASARAGNIIGGGDFSRDRLIPDCMRALKESRPINIRNPKSIRPWQHVLEPLYGYLLLGSKLLNDEKKFDGAWNFGPEKESIIPVSKVASLIIKNWGSGELIDAHDPASPHEFRQLCLNISKAKKILKWKPRWNVQVAVEKTVDWYKKAGNGNAYRLCAEQIKEYKSAFAINEQ